MNLRLIVLTVLMACTYMTPAYGADPEIQVINKDCWSRYLTIRNTIRAIRMSN